MHRLGQVCTSLQKFAQACKDLQRLTQACASLRRLAQACTGLRKLVQACTSLCRLVQAGASSCRLAQARSNFHRLARTISSSKILLVSKLCYLHAFNSISFHFSNFMSPTPSSIFQDGGRIPPASNGLCVLAGLEVALQKRLHSHIRIFVFASSKPIRTFKHI